MIGIYFGERVITINKDKYYVLKCKNGKCYLIPLTCKKSKCTKCQKKCLKKCLKKSKCLKKCKKKPLKNLHTIKVPVPKPAGISGLPKYIYFQIDNSFTDKQEQRIKDGIVSMLAVWREHHDQKWNGGANNGTSELAACTNTYAKKNLKPLWYRGKAITNGKTATNVAMNQFTQLIKDNGFKRSCPAKIKANEIEDLEVGTILGVSALTRFKVPLSIGVNPKQLDNRSLNINKLAASILHAWLHCAGFTDPKTTSYFISECAMCVMRSSKPKNPDVRDSSYYKFFD